jgi:hypothetical protein
MHCLLWFWLKRGRGLQDTSNADVSSWFDDRFRLLIAECLTALVLIAEVIVLSEEVYDATELLKIFHLVLDDNVVDLVFLIF